MSLGCTCTDSSIIRCLIEIHIIDLQQTRPSWEWGTGFEKSRPQISAPHSMDASGSPIAWPRCHQLQFSYPCMRDWVGRNSWVCFCRWSDFMSWSPNTQHCRVSVLFWKRPLVKVASYWSSLHDWDSWHSWWVRTSLGRSSGKEHAWRMFQEMQKDWDDLVKNMTGWWFGTFCIFPYIGNNHPNWLIFFRGVDTTNQMNFHEFHGQLWRFYGGGWFHHGNHGNQPTASRSD